MKAIAVFPGKPNSVHMAELAQPSVRDIPNGRGVLVKVLRVGVDGTDKEINAAEYGAARVMGINFSGFLAWWLWMSIYLSKLPRFEKKVRVALDWTLDLLFSKDLVKFVTLRAPTVSEESSEAMHTSVIAEPEVCAIETSAARV